MSKKLECPLIFQTPCGFCFVEYYARWDAESAMRYVNGTRLDDRIVRVDWDAGFIEGLFDILMHSHHVSHASLFQVVNTVGESQEDKSEMNTDKISMEAEAATGKLFIILKLISLFKIFS